MNILKNAFLCIIFIYLFHPRVVYSQQLQDDSEKYLRGLIEEIPALNEVVSLSISKAPIQELIRGIANNSGLNINIDPSLDIQVVNNFNNVKVIDVLLFLEKKYDLEITNIGNIISVNKTKVDLGPQANLSDSIQYDSDIGTISFDIRNQPLSDVARALTRKTGNNVVLAPGAEYVKINSYILNMPFESAMDKLAFSNNLKVEKTKDDFFIFHPVAGAGNNTGSDGRHQTDAGSRGSQPTSRRSQQREQNDESQLEVRVDVDDKITIFAEDAMLSDVIKEISDRMNISYFINGDIPDKKSFHLFNIEFDVLLENLLKSTEFSYRVEEGIYIIDKLKNESFIETRVVQLQNRTVSKLTETLPKSMTDGLEIIEFPELNSVLVSGPFNKAHDFETFITKIDRIVPVILIEVIIADLNKSYTISTGIEAGLTDESVETRGKVFPGVDLQISSQTVNDILQNFNGFGTRNIGVKPSFYATLKALENQGVLNVRSTPKLSTLNGHEASLSIGNTEYYLEERSDVIGTQNPQLTTSQEYKPVNAELAITINPIVSGDDQITMDIEVNQSDFTERISKFAPPGSVSRNFKSLIRVKNQEIIILGGLEEKKTTDSATGVPLLSRIPVIKWFFSSRTKVDSKSRLTVFIRPTIIN